MRRKHAVIVSYFLFLVSVFFPWFTYNPNVMGYRCGYLFLHWMALPIAVIGIFIFTKRRIIITILSELSLLSLLTIYVVLLGRWQEYCNIKTGFHWEEGFYTATVGYWVSLGLLILMVVLLQIREKPNQDNNIERK